MSIRNHYYKICLFISFALISGYFINLKIDDNRAKAEEKRIKAEVSKFEKKPVLHERLAKSNEKYTNLYPIQCYSSTLGSIYGYISEKGKIIIKPQFSYAAMFHEGFARVGKGDYTAYINKNGEVIYCEKSSSISNDDFSDGIAVTEKGLVNSRGEFIKFRKNYEAVRSFSEGLAPVLDSNTGKCGFINKQGKMVITPIFGDAFAFHDGLALVGTGNVDNRIYGYINEKGEIVIRPQFKVALNFEDSQALVKKGNEYCLINKNGEVTKNLTEGKFEYFIDGIFSEGLAGVSLDIYKNKFGYIDKQGKLIKINYYPFQFHEGLAKVKVVSSDQDDRYGFIDKKGKMVIKAKFDAATDFINGLAKVSLGNKYGYINKSGKFIWKGDVGNQSIEGL